MSNKTVWAVVVILVLVGLYYWMMPAAEVQPAPDVVPQPVVDAGAPTATDVPAGPAI